MRRVLATQTPVLNRHSRENGNLSELSNQIPVFTGMTGFVAIIKTRLRHGLTP